MEPLISIITPTYNRAHILDETLNSVLSQTYTNWECLVIDDGSEDHTEDLLQEYISRDHRFKYFKRPMDRPKGANSCRNYGFELSSGEYINWFDSDDIMHPEKLELQLKVLENSEYPLCVCQTHVFEDSIDNNLGLRHPRLISDNYWEDYLMFKILWLTQAPLWKKSFLKRLPFLYDEELHAAQEWEFHLRALHKLSGYETLNKPLVFLRMHKVSISNDSREKVLWNYFLARYKIYQRFKKELSPKAYQFLLRYFMEAYKNALRDGQLSLASRIWNKHILKTGYISLFMKMRLGLGYLSYSMFNKGDRFISGVNSRI